MNNAPAVKCPVHGEHGVLSAGQCWYCVQAGVSTPGSVVKSSSQSQSTPTTTRNRVILAYKGEK